MKPFRWPPAKNDLLKQERGVSFEEITVAVETGGLLEIVPHQNSTKYPRQKIMVVEVAGYAFLVPFVEEEDHFFLKPSSPAGRLRGTSSRRSQTMSKLDAYELEVLEAYESGSLKSVVNKAELQRMRLAARATAVKDKRVNIRLSSADLLDIQAKALAEGMPYQTLIASALHKYVSGKLAEREAAIVSRRSR